MSEIEKQGGRKAAKVREASWQVMIVFLGYSLLLWQKVIIPQEVLLLFLGAILGNLGIFTVGNVKAKTKGSNETVK